MYFIIYILDEVCMYLPYNISNYYYTQIEKMFPELSTYELINILNSLKENHYSVIESLSYIKAKEYYELLQKFNIYLIITPVKLKSIIEKVNTIIKLITSCFKINDDVYQNYIFPKDLINIVLESSDHLPLIFVDELYEYLSYFINKNIDIYINFLQNENFFFYYHNTNFIHKLYCSLFSDDLNYIPIFQSMNIFHFLLRSIYNLVNDNETNSNNCQEYNFYVIKNLIEYIKLISLNKPNSITYHDLDVVNEIFQDVLDIERLIIKPFDPNNIKSLEYITVKELCCISGVLSRQFIIKGEVFYSEQILILFLNHFKEYIQLVEPYKNDIAYPFSFVKSMLSLLLYYCVSYNNIDTSIHINKSNCDLYLSIYVKVIYDYYETDNLEYVRDMYNPYLQSLSYKSDILFLQLLSDTYQPIFYLKAIYEKLNIKESLLINYNNDKLSKIIRFLIDLYTIPSTLFNPEDVIENEIGFYLLIHHQLLNDLDIDNAVEEIYNEILMLHYDIDEVDYDIVKYLYNKVIEEDDYVKYYNPFSYKLPFSQHDSLLLLFNKCPKFKDSKNIPIHRYSELSRVIELPLCYDMILFMYSNRYNDSSHYIVLLLLKLLKILLCNPYLYTDFLAQCMIGINNNPSVFELLSMTEESKSYLSENISMIQNKLKIEYSNIRHININDYKDLTTKDRNLSLKCKGCDGLVVERYCDQCECCYCLKCNDNVHSIIENFSHFPRPLCYCGKCNSEGKDTLAELLCIDCEIFYCKTCSEEAHTSIDSKDHRFNCLYVITSKSYRSKKGSSNEIDSTSNEKLLLSNYTAYHIVILNYYYSNILGKVFNIRFKSDENKQYTLFVIPNDNSSFNLYYLIQSSLPYHMNIIRYYTHFQYPLSSQFEPYYTINNNMYHFLIFDHISMTLQTYIHKYYPLTKEIVIRILSHISKALMFLYNRNIIYRNLCKYSIVVEGDVFKLSDLSYSIITDENYYFEENNPQGVLYSLPPEVLNSNKSFNKVHNNYRKSPSWSIGVFGYELICNTLPYPNYPLQLKLKEIEINNEFKELYDEIKKLLDIDYETRLDFNDWYVYINNEYDKL